jgi:hypothetical protein
MKSRYDYLKESQVQDEDKEFFPDVLSLSYDQGVLTQIPTLHKIDSRDLSKFWKYMYERYQRTDMDDVLLNINGFPYLGMLKPGDELYEPKAEDLEGYITTRRTGEDPD